MDKILYDKIIAANIEVHEKEAKLYDIIHTFGSNWHAQTILSNDISKIIEVAPGRKACDLGCGTGNVTEKLLNAGCEVDAVDLSESMLSQLNNKVGKGGSLKVFRMNIDEFLAESAQVYDIVTIYAALHHMPNYLETISRVLNHLSPGGLLYIVDGVHRRKVNKYRVFLNRCMLRIDRMVYTSIYGNREIIYNHGIDYAYSDYHCNAAGTNGLDLDKIKALIETRGLKLVNFRIYSLGMYLGIFAMLDNMMSISRNCFRLIAKKECLG